MIIFLSALKGWIYNIYFRDAVIQFFKKYIYILSCSSLVRKRVLGWDWYGLQQQRKGRNFKWRYNASHYESIGVQVLVLNHYIYT